MKYGVVKTDHVLFIAAGAFHVAKPSDLIPELQGRFPIRVELEALGYDDFVRILAHGRFGDNFKCGWVNYVELIGVLFQYEQSGRGRGRLGLCWCGRGSVRGGEKNCGERRE